VQAAGDGPVQRFQAGSPVSPQELRRLHRDGGARRGQARGGEPLETNKISQLHTHKHTNTTPPHHLTPRRTRTHTHTPTPTPATPPHHPTRALWAGETCHCDPTH